MKPVLFALLLLLSVTAVTAHDDAQLCSELSSGAEYGVHIKEHAQEGHFSGSENPGVHHRGYSVCVP